MIRRDFLKLVSAAAGVGGFMGSVEAYGAPERTPDRGLKPNIIFILADDLGYGDLGCYGQKAIQTPNIDRMASEGMRFTDCYAGSTVCAPSRCCLMTGLHTGHAWIRGNARVPLRPQDVTVAEVLKSAGYATGLVGKWGLGEPDTTGVPNRKGFDEFFGFLNQAHAHNSYPEYLWRNETKVPLKGNVVKDGVSSVCAQYAPDLFATEALDFIERHRAHPFFLYFATTIPHANNERGRHGANGLEVPDDAPYSDRPWSHVEKNYAAMVTRLDRDVGRLMSKLKELGLDDNTIVFFTSDNGPHKEGGNDPTYFHSSGPLRGIKRDLYEGGIRAPMVARWPAHIQAGVTSERFWAFWDFLPAAADLAGANAPSGIDGVSMAPVLLGQKAAGGARRPPRFLYWEFHERGFSQAARKGVWKAVRRGATAPLELYNLKNDIGETHDVAAQHPRIVAQFERYLKSARTESEHWPSVGA